MATVLIAGGSGLVGKYLAKYLQDKAYSVRILSREKKCLNRYPTFIWDFSTGYIDEKAFSNVDFIINLAGENISSRTWSENRKEDILTSRIDSTKLLYEKTIEFNTPLRSFITASAVGYYGTITSEKIFQETDIPANDFLGNICKKWEIESHLFSENGIRTVRIRTGLVLTPKGGALEKIANPIKKGFGAVLGSGKQYVPWIHIDDLCRIYEFALQNSEFEGAYNAVAPEYTNQKNFTYAIAKALKKKIWLPNVPAFILKLILGERSDLVLFGSQISVKKIQNETFKFNYGTLETALESLFPSN